MKVYRSAILLAILILAIPGAHLFDASQTWGWPKAGDIIETQVIKVEQGFYKVYYNETLKRPKKINCVKFWDKTRSGCKVWMSKEPPCYESVVTITSGLNGGIHFVMEVFHEP